MSQSIINKAKDTSNTSNNANQIPNNNSNLIERKQIEGTPFTMIKQTMDNDKEKYFIVMGDHRLTEPTNTEEQTLEKIITEHWKIMVNVVAIVVDKMTTQDNGGRKLQMDIDRMTKEQLRGL